MKTILALGADLKSRFLIGKGKEITFGPDIGDLGQAQNFEKFKKAVRRVIKKNKPDLVGCDLHPGYFSTRFANEYSSKLNRRLIQHHHAHIASVIEEHGLKKPLLGVSFDGTGLGIDGKIWGGEFLLVDKKDSTRLAHLKYQMMPGGEKVVMEPWRMVLSILKDEGMDFVSSSGPSRSSAVGQTISMTPIASLEPKEQAKWTVRFKAISAGDKRFKVVMTSDQLTRTVEETEATKFYE